MSNPINSLDQARMPSPIHSQQRVGLRERLKTQPAGIFRRFITLPDRNPKMRYVFDITIIAIAVISIVAILAISQGQGLLLYGLIPGFVIGALGITLLISDIASTPRAQKIADTLTAILLPIVVLGLATALIASACFSAGGTALLFANPQFVMGVITIGLFFMSLSKVTCAHIQRELLDTKDKTSGVSEAAITPPQHLKDAKKVAKETKKHISRKDAKRSRYDTETRRSARLKLTKKQSQGGVSRRDLSSSLSTDTSSSSSSPTPPPASSQGGLLFDPKSSPSQPPCSSTTLRFSQGESVFQPIHPQATTPTSAILAPIPTYPPGTPEGRLPQVLRSTPRVSPSSRGSRDKDSPSKDSKHQKRDDQDKGQRKKGKNKKSSNKGSKATPPYDKRKNPFDSDFNEDEK